MFTSADQWRQRSHCCRARFLPPSAGAFWHRLPALGWPWGTASPDHQDPITCKLSYKYYSNIKQPQCNCKKNKKNFRPGSSLTQKDLTGTSNWRPFRRCDWKISETSHCSKAGGGWTGGRAKKRDLSRALQWEKKKKCLLAHTIGSQASREPKLQSSCCVLLPPWQLGGWIIAWLSVKGSVFENSNLWSHKARHGFRSECFLLLHAQSEESNSLWDVWDSLLTVSQSLERRRVKQQLCLVLVLHLLREKQNESPDRSKKAFKTCSSSFLRLLRLLWTPQILFR